MSAGNTRGDFEAGNDADVAELLSRLRPNPTQQLQEDLEHQLRADDPGWGSRPKRLWPQAVFLICLGVTLLILGTSISIGRI